jgi:putative tryptophan/tyrosine transport system substrate-binding protein
LPLSDLSSAFGTNNPRTASYASHMFQAMKDAAASFGVTLRDAPCHDDADIERVIAGLAQQGSGGLLPIAEIFNQMHGKSISTLALKYKVPTMVFSSQMIESGGLISYAIDFPDLFRRSADYVDRILKGKALANLPVQAPTKFKLTINLKTAKALGLTIPTALLAAADARKASSRSFPSPTSSPTSRSPMGGSG